ncbi:MAG TPA: hypothetical protein VHS99_15980, partial [Chloroflexota bacterium]|nr:hypothetical protein [Chloroflexota bacterium]
MPLSFKRAVRPEWLLAAAAIDGAGLLAGFLADRGQLSLSAGLATLGVWGLGAVAWRLAYAQSFRFRVPSSELAADAESRWLGAAPLLPWLASWPLLVLLAIDPLARAQLFQARLAVGVYLLGWLGAGLAALALWVRAVAPRSAPRSARSSESRVPSPG